MSGMQIVQQKQPIPSHEKVVASLKVGAILLIQTIAVVASTIFTGGLLGVAVAMGLSLGMAIDLKKDRAVVLVTATAFTTLIAAVSIAILFPPAAPVMLPLICIAASVSFLFGMARECQQIHVSNSQKKFNKFI